MLHRLKVGWDGEDLDLRVSSVCFKTSSRPAIILVSSCTFDMNSACLLSACCAKLLMVSLHS